MQYMVNGGGEALQQVKFDRCEVFASVGATALGLEEDAVSVFSSEEEFLDWLRRSEPKIAGQISQLMTGLTQLSIAHREKGAELTQSLQSLIDEKRKQRDNSRSGLVLFEQVNFGGRSVEAIDLVPYPDLNLLPSWRFNDKTSSLKLSNTVCAVFEHTWFKGRSWWMFPGPKSVPWVGEWWDDRISSCVCGPSYEEILRLILRYLL